MAAGDKIQIGKLFAVEFGNAKWTGTQMTALSRSRGAAVETITDTRGANTTHIISNKASQIEITAYLEDGGGFSEPPAVGSVIRITEPGETRPSAWILLSPATISFSNSVTTISASLSREDSMADIYEEEISAVLAASQVNFSIGGTGDLNTTLTLNLASDSVESVKWGAIVLTSAAYNVIGLSPSKNRTLRLYRSWLSSQITTVGAEVNLTIRFTAGLDRQLKIKGIA